MHRNVRALSRGLALISELSAGGPSNVVQLAKRTGLNRTTCYRLLDTLSEDGYVTFDETNALETFLFDSHIHKYIGTDLSTGIEYKPLVSENVVFMVGSSILLPGQGFRDIYNNFNDRVTPLVAGFLFLNFAY